MTGLMEVNGRDGGVPRRIGLEVASVAAGILAAQGELAAEIARRRGRPVGQPRTSVLQAGLLLMSNYFVVATALGDALPGMRLEAPGPPFRSADGRLFEIEALDPDPWRDFWMALGVDAPEAGRGWRQFQWRYERATCSLPAGLHDAAGRRSLAELRRLAEATRVSLVPVRGYAELPAGLERDRWPSLHGVGASPRPAPGRAGTGPARPLAGVRMVEATSRIQGPLAGMLLRMLGAEVVRVQPPEGDYGRAALCLHREKQVERIDLGTASGRAQVRELIAAADVFLHNWRPGKAAEWGLGFTDLVPHHPHLVYAHASGWGDRPESHRLIGTDFLVQAYTGMGDGLNPAGEPPVPSRMVLCDLFGALVGAEGVLGALYRREREGGAWEVRSSLLTGAVALQAHVFDGLARRSERGRHRGRPVWGELDRPVPVAGGLLAVTPDTLEEFCDAVGVERDAGAGKVRAHLTRATAAEWEATLNAAGIPAAAVCDNLAAVPCDARFAGLFEPVGDGGFAPCAPWEFR